MNVYTPIKEKIILAHHKKPNTNYVVTYGYVDWDRDGNLKPAIYVLMEYNGIISYKQPAHIVTEKNEDGKSDFDNVMEAINQLKEEYGL